MAEEEKKVVSDETGYIKSLSITYLNANNTNANKYVPTEGYRLNPVRYEGTLVSQQSSVTVPILVEEKNDSYEIIETKYAGFLLCLSISVQRTSALLCEALHALDSLFDEVKYDHLYLKIKSGIAFDVPINSY